MDDDFEIPDDDGKRARKPDRTSVGAVTWLCSVGLSVIGLAIIAIGILGAYTH